MEKGADGREKIIFYKNIVSNSKLFFIQIFARMDKDADGRVTEQEFMNACLGL